MGLPPDITTEVEIVQAIDSVDYTIESRLRDKIHAMSQVLDDKDLRALAYDPEDIIEDIPGGIDKQDVDDIRKHLEGDK